MAKKTAAKKKPAGEALARRAKNGMVAYDKSKTPVIVSDTKEYFELVAHCQQLLNRTEDVAKFMYWEIGHKVRELTSTDRKETYGNKSVRNLAQDLGIDSTTLYRAGSFVDKYPEKKLVPRSSNISWDHIKVLVSIPDEAERLEFQKAAEKNGWPAKKLQKEYRDMVTEREDPRSPKPKFNRTNASVDWAVWTWNPLTGCKHDCIYCYAYDLREVRFKGKKGYENGMDPHFYPERLEAPKNTKIKEEHMDDPAYKRVFVCSMADMFGSWVEKEQIDQIMKAVRDYPEWTYIFLTKNPKRLLEVDWPDNCWVGATIDRNHRIADAMKVFMRLKKKHKNLITFVSCEPFLEELKFRSFEPVDLVIIGAQTKVTRAHEIQPEWSWVERVFNQARKDGCNVYFKHNLKSKPKELPRQ